MRRRANIAASTARIRICEPKLGLSPFDRGLRIAGFFEIGARDGAPSARRTRQLIAETRAFLGQPDSLRADPADPGWAGFRPSTPDSLPLIGPAGSRPGGGLPEPSDHPPACVGTARRWHEPCGAQRRTL